MRQADAPCLPTTSQWSLSSSCTARLACQHGVLTSPCPSVIPTARHCSTYTLKELLKNSWADTVLVLHNIGLDWLSMILTPPCPCVPDPFTACPHCSPLQPLHIQVLKRTHLPALSLLVPTVPPCSPYTFKDSLKNPWVDTVLVFHDIGLDRLVNSYRNPALVDRAVTYVSCPNTRHVMDLDNITNSVVVTSGGSLTFQNMIMQVMTAGIYLGIYILYCLENYLVYYTYYGLLCSRREGGREAGEGVMAVMLLAPLTALLVLVLWRDQQL